MHPQQILHGASSAPVLLPVCDHYCGTEERMRKSLALQAELAQEFGTCVVDVTLDCEDGAPVGAEKDQAILVAELAAQAMAASKSVAAQALPRVAVRVHPVHHPAFKQDCAIVLGRAGAALCHVMLPKAESVADVDCAVQAIDAAAALCGRSEPVPLHVLLESQAAVHRAFDIAAHPRVQSLSFGLMDFVSSHAGAIGVQAMGVLREGDAGLDQFHHPLVVQAKLQIAAACHAWGKVPSHCVVTEYQDTALVHKAAQCAAQSLGYTRMWSIHPAQIRPILDAFAPLPQEVDLATEVLLQAQTARWAPIALGGRLHDRASYRYFWHVLARAQRCGRPLAAQARPFFADDLAHAS